MTTVLRVEGHDTFDTGGKGADVMAHHGLTADKVADRVRSLVDEVGRRR